MHKTSTKVKISLLGLSFMLAACAGNGGTGSPRPSTISGMWLPMEDKPAFEAAHSAKPQSICTLVLKKEGGAASIKRGNAIRIENDGSMLECDLFEKTDLVCTKLPTKMDIRSGAIDINNSGCKSSFLAHGNAATMTNSCQAKGLKQLFRVSREDLLRYFQTAQSCLTQ